MYEKQKRVYAQYDEIARMNTKKSQKRRCFLYFRDESFEMHKGGN